MKNLTDKSYWDSVWDVETKKAGKLKKVLLALKSNAGKRKFMLLLRKYIPKAQKNKEAIEIGCCPGQFLEIVSALGYKVSGLDFSDKLDEVRIRFQENGFHVTELIQADFTEYRTEKKYDLVMSFGFVEHFSNYQEIIKRHCDLVQDNGGYLLITAPNYRKGFQNVLLDFFDLFQIKAETHNMDAMNPKNWENICVENGLVVLWSGYFGTPTIPFVNRDGFCKKVMTGLVWSVLLIIFIIPLLFRSKSGKLSGQLGIVAIKQGAR